MSILCGEESNHVTDDNESQWRQCIIHDEHRVEQKDQKPDDLNKSPDVQRSRKPLLPVFGEVSTIRDFFLAAFSDGCNSVRNLSFVVLKTSAG